jgi:N-acetylmuramoyl-L-alanine amidase
MLKACLALACLCLFLTLPVRAFDWEEVTLNGREYVSLRSFCEFYQFGYQAPSGNDRFVSRNPAGHSISLKLGTCDMYLDGVHFVMSFPIEGGDHDWLVSRMDVIKLFEPILRPGDISGRHTIRGVVIDAGHGGSDNGAASRLGAEKNYTIDTAYRLDAILRNAGLRTALTRRSDVFVDLYERAHIASLYSDYCFVSIHFNSAEAEAHGLET